MNDETVAIYCLCDDILRAINYRDHFQWKATLQFYLRPH